MVWKIEFDAKARKEFLKLNKNIQKEIQQFLRKKLLFAKNPKQFGKPLLYSKSGLWRYRVR